MTSDCDKFTIVYGARFTKVDFYKMVRDCGKMNDIAQELTTPWRDCATPWDNFCTFVDYLEKMSPEKIEEWNTKTPIDYGKCEKCKNCYKYTCKNNHCSENGCSDCGEGEHDCNCQVDEGEGPTEMDYRIEYDCLHYSFYNNTFNPYDGNFLDSKPSSLYDEFYPSVRMFPHNEGGDFVIGFTIMDKETKKNPITVTFDEWQVIKKSECHFYFLNVHHGIMDILAERAFKSFDGRVDPSTFQLHPVRIACTCHNEKDYNLKLWNPYLDEF
jgi:hypothetical protein